MPISASITLDIEASEVTTSPGLEFSITTADGFAPGLAEGDGLNEVELAYTLTQTAASNATATISLLSLYDERGTVAFSAVKLIYLKNRGPGTAWIGGTFPFGDGDELELSPGAVTMSCDPSALGFPVDTSGTAFSTFTFRAMEDSATCAVDLILLGEGSVTEG
jgi:hypothetical protein